SAIWRRGSASVGVARGFMAGRAQKPRGPSAGRAPGLGWFGGKTKFSTSGAEFPTSPTFLFASRRQAITRGLLLSLTTAARNSLSIGSGNCLTPVSRPNDVCRLTAELVTARDGVLGRWIVAPWMHPGIE